MDVHPLHRAKAYPYRIPDYSYLLVDGSCQALPRGAPLPDLSGRRPVLACGSNQSPEQLGRKFGGGDGDAILVTRAWLEGFDVVYSAHFSSYGAIPATLQRAPGTTVGLSITWLTPTQLRRMHETESVGLNYDFGHLDDIALTLVDGDLLDGAFAYVSRRGCLTIDGTPVSLAAMEAVGRSWPALHQEQMQAWARDRLAPDRPLDRFIADNIDDMDIRRTRIETLSAGGRPFAYDGFVHIAV
jgi:hypothetical protein